MAIPSTLFLGESRVRLQSVTSVDSVREGGTEGAGKKDGKE